jgi:hypothetical protein
MKKLFFVLMALLPAISIFSQDCIYKKNNQTIHCKIIEIGLVEVKYLIPELYKDVVMVIAKDDISKIKYGNGEEQTFANEMGSKDSYSDNKLNAIKFHIFSPLYDYLSVSYERSLKAGQSLEGTLGIIGIGDDQLNANPEGAFAKFGYKFIKSPDFYLRGMRYAHLLKGAYFKPEIALAVFSANQNNYDYSTDNNYNKLRNSTLSVALLLNVGKQWVFDNRFAVDFSIGLGYGITNIKKDDSSVIYQYGFNVEPDTGLAWTSNFKVAYLF